MTKTNVTPFVPEHELKGIQERAIKRAENRVEEREHLRLEIKARKLIEEMQQAAMVLYFGYEELPLQPGETVPKFARLGRDRIAALKAAADISDKLLKKVLPDLKQIELTEGEGGAEGRILENIDLDNRMRIYVEALAKRQLAAMPIEDAIIVDDMDFLK